MNKQFAFIILTLFVSAQLHSQLIKIEDPIQYLPSELKNIKIGKPMNDFTNAKDTLQLLREASPDFIRYTENVNTGIVKTVAYKFDIPEGIKNKEMPLYEILIIFLDSAAAEKFVDERFTSFARTTEVSEKEWFLPTSKEYRMLIRKQGVKIMIAASMNGTEWGYD
jgi:hypothetical protein